MITKPLRLVAILLLTGACADLSTGVEAFQLEADGDLWTAIAPPPDLPDATTWLRYADLSAGDAGRAGVQVAALREDASRAMARGDLAGSGALLERAAKRSIGAMGTRPEPGVFLSAMASIESWETRVRDGVDLSRAPALAATLQQLSQDRETVSQAIRSDDTAGAALALTRASDRVREWGPQGVALRALARVETRLAASARPGDESERVAHLVRSAREALMNGNQVRAVKRALYALQLAGGAQIQEIPVADRSTCGEFAC